MFSICQRARAPARGVLWMNVCILFWSFTKAICSSTCYGNITPCHHAADSASNPGNQFFFLLVICTSGVRCILENVNTSYGRSTQHPPSWLLLRAVHCCRVQLTWKGQLEISTSSHELKNAKISGKNATFPNLTFCTIEGWKDKIRLHLYRFIQRYYWQNFDTQQV